MILNNQYYELLLNYRNYYGKYHHHKEMMAWVATGLYLSFVIFLLKMNNHCCLQACTIYMFLFFLIASIIVFYFICWQFKKREIAARIVSSCTTLLTCYLNGCKLSKYDFRPSTIKDFGDDVRWPQILKKTYENNDSGDATSRNLTIIILILSFICCSIKVVTGLMSCC